MSQLPQEALAARHGVVLARGEEPRLSPGDRVRVSQRFAIGHYRVPRYLRGKRGEVLMIISPRIVDNEQEGFGRNVGAQGYYYRIAFRMLELWPTYSGAPQDELRIEVFESWLEEAT